MTGLMCAAHAVSNTPRGVSRSKPPILTIGSKSCCAVPLANGPDAAGVGATLSLSFSCFSNLSTFPLMAVSSAASLPRAVLPWLSEISTISSFDSKVQASGGLLLFASESCLCDVQPVAHRVQGGLLCGLHLLHEQEEVGVGRLRLWLRRGCLLRRLCRRHVLPRVPIGLPLWRPRSGILHVLLVQDILVDDACLRHGFVCERIPGRSRCTSASRSQWLCRRDRSALRFPLVGFCVELPEALHDTDGAQEVEAGVRQPVTARNCGVRRNKTRGLQTAALAHASPEIWKRPVAILAPWSSV